MSKQREKEIQAKLMERSSSDVYLLFKELMELRFERHKNALVSVSCDMARGRAQESRDILKFLDTTI
jgi:hypothetical protein